MLQLRQKVLAKAPSTHDPKRTSIVVLVIATSARFCLMRRLQFRHLTWIKFGIVANELSSMDQPSANQALAHA
jgi:hypothetical protein